MNPSQEMIIGSFKAPTKAACDRLVEIVLQNGGSILAARGLNFVAHWEVAKNEKSPEILRAVSKIRAARLGVSGGLDLHVPQNADQASILDPRLLRQCIERTSYLAQVTNVKTAEILITDATLEALEAAPSAAAKIGQLRFSEVPAPVNVYRMAQAA